MFKNHLILTLRNLGKQKIYSFITIFGLSIGLTCSMLMIAFVSYEFSYDRYNKKFENIYRIGREITSAEGEMREPLSSAMVAPTLKQIYPEVEETVRFKDLGKVIVRYNDKKFYEDYVSYVDPSVFKIFTLPILRGNVNTALAKPNSVVITREMAVKYFGKEDAMGKVLKFDNKNDFIVTGVIKNIPETSHRKINMLCSFASLTTQNQPDLNEWLSFNYSTYILLKNGADYKTLEAKFPRLIKEYIGENTKKQQGTLKFYLMPLNKIYLYNHLDGAPPGLISKIISYCVLTVFILLIACINFINLSTARSSRRAKEIGLRKVIGANRIKLIKQFLSESILISLFAMVLAFFISQMLLPLFSSSLEVNLSLNPFKNFEIYIGFISLTLITGLISGIYPAFYLSKFQPIDSLKNNVMKQKRSTLRASLVVVQFFLSFMLICQTMVFDNQVNYIENIDTGFHKKDVVTIPVIDKNIIKSFYLFKTELLKNPDIVSISSSSSLPGFGIQRDIKIPEGFSNYEMQLMDEINVDADFINTLDIKIEKGRNFINDNKNDIENSIIINQLAAKKFGWSNPIGKTIEINTDSEQKSIRRVIGVVKDFHISSLNRVIEPLFISNESENINHILIRVRPGRLSSAIGLIQNKWEMIYPDAPFSYDLLEPHYDLFVVILKKIADDMSFFSGIAILLACLGIFALTAFISEQRTKEIGIRKILGDTTAGILWRLNYRLLKYVLIAMVLFLPLTYFSRDYFRQYLPYTTSIDYFLYIKGLLLVLGVALCSVFYQSFKSALANPVESLRYE